MENGVNPETGEMADPTACGEPMAALVAKVVRACLAMKAVEKAGENPHFRYKYIRLEDVISEVRRTLLAEGVYFYRGRITTPQYEMRESADKRIGTFVRVDVEYVLTDGHAQIVLPATAEARGTDDKCLQKAQSSALKYALFQNFLLQAEEGMDIDEGDGQVERGNRPQAQPPRRATVTQHTSVGTQPGGQPQRAATTAPASEPAPTPTQAAPTQGRAESGAKTGFIGAKGAALIEQWIEERHKQHPDRPKQSSDAILKWAEKDEGNGQKKRSIGSLAEMTFDQFNKLAATWGMVEQPGGAWMQRAK